MTINVKGQLLLAGENINKSIGIILIYVTK